MTTDPVCKMTLDEEKAPYRSEHAGKTYFFCGMGCRDRFDKDPEKYLRGGHVEWIAEDG